MKKFFSMMAVIAAMFAFASCTDTPAEGLTPEATKLATPVVEIVDVTETGFTAKWAAVEGATSYAISTNITDQKLVNTSEASYKFENLNKGEYTVRVKASGEGKEDSDFSEVKKVTITGATSADWFTQTVALVEDNAENRAMGRYTFNAVDFVWKGTGVKELFYGMFETESIASMSDEEIVSNMQYSLDGEMLAEVNSAEGFARSFTGLQGSTSYTLCALATNEAGVKYLAKGSVTTTETQLTDQAKAWIGTWTAKSTEILAWVTVTDEDINGDKVVDEKDAYTDLQVKDGEIPYELAITPYPGYTDFAFIDGLSVWGADMPNLAQFIIGQQGQNYLVVANGTLLDEDYGIEWATVCEINGYDGIPDGTLSFVGGGYETFIFELTDNGVVCQMGSGYLNEEKTATYDAVSTDVYVAEGNSYYLYGEDTNQDGTLGDDEVFTEYHAGAISGFVKTADEVQTASVRKAAHAMPLKSNIGSSVIVK